MNVATVTQMRAMDHRAITEFGIPELLLMENAGIAAFRVLSEDIGIGGRRFAVICGPGNNGGDGFVVARKILSDGGLPQLLVLGDPGKYHGASRTNFELMQTLSIPMTVKPDRGQVAAAVARCECIVDAILGTGLNQPVKGAFAESIGIVNDSGKPVLSLDIPSGISGDTGRVMGTAVKADATVTFGLPKAGTLLYPGFYHCGRLFVSHITFPPVITEDDALTIHINSPPPIPPRSPWGHKGSFGDVLFIAGAKGYYGAPIFAAMAVLKAGGGYSRLAAPESLAPTLAGRGGEIVLIPQRETKEGTIAIANQNTLLDIARRTDMTVIGPGLSLNPETGALVRELSSAIDRPLLIDGDGITAVAETPSMIRHRKAPTILTPHPGEMARLAGLKTEQILEDPIAVVRDNAEALDAIIVLKGAHSLIGTPDGRVWINMTGNDGMATAGSGDVLTGVIAAMHGMGMPLPEAVCKGVFIHGLAGDLASASIGPDGMTASDILDALPEAVSRDRSASLPKRDAITIV